MSWLNQKVDLRRFTTHSSPSGKVVAAWTFARYFTWGQLIPSILATAPGRQFFLLPLWTAAFIWWYLDRRILPGARRPRSVRRHAAMLRARGLRGRWRRVLLAALVWGLAAPLIWAALTGACRFTELGHGTSSYSAFKESGFGPLGDVALGLLRLVGYPLLEEFIFRGWLLYALRRLRPVVAVLISSTLFAFAHLDPIGFHYNMWAGIVTGYAVMSTRSIWSAVALHLAHNLSVAITRSDWGMAHYEVLTTSPLWDCRASFLVLLAASAAIFLLLRTSHRGSVRR